jgi:phenylalanyl-tRNA synthetase beta chain
MAELAGGTLAEGRVDAFPAPMERPRLTLRVQRTNRFLGTSLDAAKMADLLRSIEMKVEEDGGHRLTVMPPAFRPDIEREEDLAEEIARLVGYDHIPVTYPQAVAVTEPVDPHLKARQELKQRLVGWGFSEVINFSFISTQSLRELRYPADDPRMRTVPLANPLSEEQAVMRTSLLPGLLQNVVHNVNHGNENLRLFEMGKVFWAREGEPLPFEPHRLAGVMTGARYPHLLYGGDAEVDFADLKGVVEGLLEPFRASNARFSNDEAVLPPWVDPAAGAAVDVSGEIVGALGRLHPEVQERLDVKRSVHVFSLDFEKLYGLGLDATLFRPLPRFPSVVRDLALVVDRDLAVREPMDFIRNLQEPLLERVEIFDLFKDPKLGEGRKSVGYRLVYRAPDRNLTDSEVNLIHERLSAEVLRAFSAERR